MRYGAVFAFLLLVWGGCTEPRESAESVPGAADNERVREHPAISVDARTSLVGMVEDQVIGGVPDEAESLFFRVRGIAVDDSGKLFVNDAGNHRVQVFDARGEFLSSVGREGQGPGEVTRAASITVAGDSFVVVDYGPLRLSWWHLDGQYLGSAPARLAMRVFGFADGTVAATYRIFGEENGQAVVRRAFVRLSAQGEEIAHYATRELPHATTPSVPITLPDLAVDPAGTVYVMDATDYEVGSFDAADSERWVLTTNWPARQVPAEDIRRYETVRRQRWEDGDQLAPLEPIDWPERIPALSRIAVDGHGHLYIFPFVYLPLDLDNPPPVPDRIPVDVYSSTGERLFVGTIPSHGELRGGWAAAWRDFVYRSVLHPETREAVVVRYRLIEPFE